MWPGEGASGTLGGGREDWGRSWEAVWRTAGVHSGGGKRVRKCPHGPLAVGCGQALGWSQRQRGVGGQRATGGAGGCASHPAPTACRAAAPGSPFFAVGPQPRPGLLSGAEPSVPSLPQQLRACMGQPPRPQGWDTWAGTYDPRDPGNVTSVVLFPSTERRRSWNRKDAGNPPQCALPCPCRLGPRRGDPATSCLLCPSG